MQMYAFTYILCGKTTEKNIRKRIHLHIFLYIGTIYSMDIRLSKNACLYYAKNLV